MSGPTTLKIGESGTWTINASDPENGPLNYSVHWGDEPLTAVPVAGAPSAERAYNQTATFTHIYSRAGTFYPKFWVRDNAGNTQWTSLSVTVTAGNVARVTVTSPNGGENWVANTTRTIKWSTVNTIRNDKVDIYLQPYFWTCDTTSTICPAYSQPEPAPILLDRNILVGATYNWIVATDIDNNAIPAGSYFMKVCLVGTNTCDQSDLGFDITAQ